jgi:5'(3')-deoxyribonucleotidase
VKRVLLDCDGVLADFVSAALDIVWEEFGLRFLPAEVTEFDIMKSLGFGPEDSARFKRLVGGEEGLASTLAVYPGAQEGVARLREIAEVYIVTSPFGSNPTWTHDREAWLKRHFGIKSSHVVHARAKHLCVGDMLVDDKAEAVDRWRTAHPNGVPVLWSTLHNRRDLWDGQCTNDWGHLVELVERMP